MGIIEFESWQAMGLACLCWGEGGGRGEGFSALTGSSVCKTFLKVQEAKLGPF